MSSRSHPPWTWLYVVLALGCSTGSISPPEQRPRGVDSPRSRSDASVERDAASPRDASAASDADIKDAAPRDASSMTSTNPDASEPDSSVVDAGHDSGPPEPPPRPLDPRAVQIDTPFGIAPSASSSKKFAEWAAPISATGIRWVRGIDPSTVVERLDTAAAHELEVSGILLWSSAAAPSTLPVDDIPGWRAYVKQLVEKCKGKVKYWEVWNEPPNFTTNKAASDYAKIVVAAYEEIKKVDPGIQVGIATHSNNVTYLDQALAAGAAGHFDYITVHPYELLTLANTGWEPVFMRVVPTLRRMLAKRDAAHMNVPIWFTEIGQAVTPPVTAEDQAASIIRAYTLGFAQGVARIAWFESLDGDSGAFGLIAMDGKPRPAYTALKTLIKLLGPNPRYFGWVLLNNKHYAFVFQGARSNVLIAWARPGATEAVTFEAPVKLMALATASETSASQHMLTATPIAISDIPDKLIDEAHANRSKPFTWSGDGDGKGAATFTAPATTNGLHLLGDAATVVIAGESARDCSKQVSQTFAVDPNFLSYDTVKLQITAVIRPIGADMAGFNFRYESTTGNKGTGAWYYIPAGEQWTTQTWTLEDTQFVGTFGYNFSFDSDSTMNSKYLIKSVTVTKL